MRKHIVNEFEVATSADTLWAIYSTPQFPKLIVELLPTIYQKMELIEGDGSPGTVFNVTFVPGMIMPSYKGKLVTIDHENHLKEVEHVEGGYLELGCSYYMNSFQIMEKDCDSCIIKFTVTYELAKDADPNVDDLVNNFTGKVSNTVEIGVPANEVWEIYGTLEVGKLIDKFLPHIIGNVELVEGDGGLGTVLKVTLPPGTPGASYFKEKFTKIDNLNRIKESEVIEGGFLYFGYTLYRIIIEIVDGSGNSSIIKSAIEYEIEDDSDANESFVSLKPFEAIAEVVQKYLLEKAKT